MKHIQYNRETRLFSLTTDHSLYQMKADEAGVLLHLYYGPDTKQDMSYLIRYADRGFSGNPYDQQENRGYSLDTLPQEYSGSGVGDYRLSAAQVIGANGSRSVDFRFTGFKVYPGRKPLTNLPYVREGSNTETLEILLEDAVWGLQARILYHVFPEQDVIVRSVQFINQGTVSLQLEKAASVCLDFPYGNFEVMHFHGRHCMERIPERLSLPRGISSFGSRRGMSSHQNNPFIVLCDPHATENAGECYGVMLMYSGNHLEEIEVDQTGSVRVAAGIHPDGFSWLLNPGDSFQTPEALLSFSAEGLNGLSNQYHRIIRECIIPPAFRKAPAQVLINSWEAAYFYFNSETILHLAENAKDLGMDMVVMDDGWFGKRDDDCSGLGDWAANEKKLGCTLGELSEKIHGLGLKFGLWFEPEMVNEDSDLFRAHPDWALTDPGRKPMVARRQLVLDMSRQDVVDHLFTVISDVLDHAKIEYVKWDFNRSVANVFSNACSAERQGEIAHRFMLGTYQLLSRLTARYPDLMIEGCSGGGGRFDAGMLFYCPQIWCSDDSDAIERLVIQRGTSYGYPVSTMGSHVSATPNHQTGKTTPLNTRGIVAQSGTFGYEMNPAMLSDQEKETVKAQIAAYRRFQPLISEGTYYRLTEWNEQPDLEAWMFVSPDQSECLVNLVMIHPRSNGPFPFIRLQGLKSDKRYALEGTEQTFTGAALMQGGYSLAPLWGDYPAKQLHFREV